MPARRLDFDAIEPVPTSICELFIQALPEGGATSELQAFIAHPRRSVPAMQMAVTV